MDVLTEEIKHHPNLKLSSEDLRAMGIHLNIELLTRRRNNRDVQVFNPEFKKANELPDQDKQPPKDPPTGEPNAATLAKIKTVPELPRGCLNCGEDPGIDHETVYLKSGQDFHLSDNWEVHYHPNCKKGSTESQIKVRRT